MRPTSSIHTDHEHGFTLVELVIVILILGILAGIAAPKLLSVSSDSEAAAILTNVKTVFDAAERFAAEHGRLPKDSNQGLAPEELEGYLSLKIFTEIGVFGDYYDWHGTGTALPSYGVSLHVPDRASPVTHAVYKAIEQRADDGSPTTGWITVRGQHIFFELAPNDGALDAGTPVP